MGRPTTNRKIYHITLDNLSRKSIEYLSKAEGMSLSHVISKTILEYMTDYYPDKLDSIRQSMCEEEFDY